MLLRKGQVNLFLHYQNCCACGIFILFYITRHFFLHLWHQTLSKKSEKSQKSRIVSHFYLGPINKSPCANKKETESYICIPAEIVWWYSRNQKGQLTMYHNVITVQYVLPSTWTTSWYLPTKELYTIHLMDVVTFEFSLKVTKMILFFLLLLPPPSWIELHVGDSKAVFFKKNKHEKDVYECMYSVNCLNLPGMGNYY